MLSMNDSRSVGSTAGGGSAGRGRAAVAADTKQLIGSGTAGNCVTTEAEAEAADSACPIGSGIAGGSVGWTVGGGRDGRVRRDGAVQRCQRDE